MFGVFRPWGLDFASVFRAWGVESASRPSGRTPSSLVYKKIASLVYRFLLLLSGGAWVLVLVYKIIVSFIHQTRAQIRQALGQVRIRPRDRFAQFVEIPRCGRHFVPHSNQTISFSISTRQSGAALLLVSRWCARRYSSHESQMFGRLPRWPSSQPDGKLSGVIGFEWDFGSRRSNRVRCENV